MAAAPIKIGLIGLSPNGYMRASWAAVAHFPYLNQSPHYTITALQNSSIESAKAAAATFGLKDVACYGDIESLVKDPNVDLVVVSVKVPKHYELIEPALRAGKDVFSEWPLGANLSEAEKLTQLAKEKNARTICGLQARQSPAIRKAKEMVAAGELGDILGTTMTGTGMLGGAQTPEDLTYALPIEAGANLVTIPAMHAIDAFCEVVGEFESLQATLANNHPQVSLIDNEGKELKKLNKTAHDWMSVTGKLKNGGVGTVVYQGGISSTGKDFYWEINGTKGSLVLEGPSGHIQMYAPTLKYVSAEPGSELEAIDLEDGSSLSYAVGREYEGFAEKKDGFVTFENALLRHHMIEAIYESDKNGRRESYI